MLPRIRLFLVVLGACAAVAVVVALVASRSDHVSSVTSDSGYAGSLRPAGIPAMDFTLRDQDGKTVSLRSLRGAPVVVGFMYSTCKDTCPIQAQQIKGALNDVRSAPPALAVSVDPANDTPESARRFLVEQRATGRIRFLLGSRAQLQPIWRQFGVQPQGQGFEHTASVVLLDGSGRQCVGFPVSELVPEDLAHDIEVLQRRDAICR